MYDWRSLQGEKMHLQNLIDEIKRHRDYAGVGMILCHNGVVRAADRDGRAVKGLEISVDQAKLAEVVALGKQQPGIMDIRVHIFSDRYLKVGEDVMYLVVAGDIREHVLKTLEDTLNTIKKTVTTKVQDYVT